ncbi:EamA family transporter [Catenuloplanes atrovinosus]|uniref:Drug/metabolite transporter (DMT)-like permease n=1 Tax=Catenuloplanes atrovinosus TaxID=137266 RepID=A0AAE3YJI5_9ACTN|nr:DMT family transporter [Catenuloplanes atrovinosus]MDR7273647.1 drug/metabolite transporter (DMT)-like permease [Catenuloplanes atrovinosus]
MRQPIGLVAALASAASFATSGAFVKPLLEAGWSPAAAVSARTLSAGLLLLPLVLWSLRGRWATLWRARWRVLGMGLIAVAFTQVTYFAAISRIPVSTALLVEYLAPLLLVLWAWVSTRRAPHAVVLLGSVLAIGGLVLVIGPGAVRAVDPAGLGLAFAAAVGCAVYFAVGARPADGLPPVALAGSGLLLGGLLLALVGTVGLLPFTADFGDVTLLGSAVPWFVPLSVVAIFGTAIAYATGIFGAGRLGSRLASFIGLLEVVFASVFAWLLLGENLTITQLAGGVLILAGIASVHAAPPQISDVAPVTDETGVAGAEPGASAPGTGTGTGTAEPIVAAPTAGGA